MIEISEKEAQKEPIVNRMDCKNYVKCLVKFGQRCFKSDESEKITCVNCANFEQKC